MAKKTIMQLTRDDENDRIDMQIYAKPQELAAYMCAMMEKDKQFKASMLVAVEVFVKEFKPPPPPTKPFAEA